MGRSNFMLQFMLDTTLSDAEKFPLKMADLIVTSVNPTTAPESIVWCSDPKNVIKEAPTVGLPGDYFYSPMQLQGQWDDYSETICSIDPSGRGSDETAATYIPSEWFLVRARNACLQGRIQRQHASGHSQRVSKTSLKLLIETNFGDGIVAELFKKHLVQTNKTST